MTDTNKKLRGLFLAALMVLSVFAGTVAFAGAGAATNHVVRDHDNVYSTPVTVFQGEEAVDITGAGYSSSVTFTGVAGDADGTVVVADDATAVDFTDSNGFDLGGYSTDNDDSVEFSVREASISDVTLYAGTDDSGPDVTNGIVTQDSVAVETDFNFQRADRVEIAVEDDAGFDVTGQVVDASSQANVVEESGDFYYTGPTGGEFTMDISGVSEGQYNVTMAGDELSSAERTVSFTKGDADVEISLDKTSVVRGEKVIATVTGAPGATQYVQIDTGDLRTDTTTASDVFDKTGDVVSRGSASGSAYAEVDLGDSGSARVRINTQALSTGTVTVEAADGAGGEAVDDVDLSVKKAKISISDAPSAVAVGEDFTMNGTAPEVDTVRAYVRVDDTWTPVNGDDSNGVDVENDGTFKLDLDASGELAIPGNYRVGVAGFDEGETPPPSIASDEWGDEITPTASTSLRTHKGNLSASLSRNEVAKDVGDEVTLSGVAVGQSEVHAYVIKPRGGVVDVSINVEDDNTFDEALSTFDQAGTYQVIVAGIGRDDQWDDKSDTGGNPAPVTSSQNTQNQNAEIIMDYHDGAGIDDVTTRLNLTASNAFVSFTSGAELPQEEGVKITGRSNREPGTIIFVEMNNQQGNTVMSTQTEVTESGTWNVTFDLSDVARGSYTLRAEGDEASATMDVSVVRQMTPTTATPTPTPTTATPTPTPTTATPTPTTATPTPTTTTTTGGGPGFGVAVSLVALLGAALIALRRRN